MKHFFFVAIISGILSVSTINVTAQTSVNMERLAGKSRQSAAPKFIEHIEIKPGVQQNDLLVVTKSERAVMAPTENIDVSATIEHCTSWQFKYAMLTDMDVESVTNATLYNFIEDWWATRYRYGGSDKKGVDCSSFVGQLFSNVYNSTLPRTAKEQYNFCEKISRDELKEGDLVFFNTRGGVSHVGMYLGNNAFVHSSTNSGVTISKLTEDYYNRKFIGGGRVR